MCVASNVVAHRSVSNGGRSVPTRRNLSGVRESGKNHHSFSSLAAATRVSTGSGTCSKEWWNMTTSNESAISWIERFRTAGRPSSKWTSRSMKTSMPSTCLKPATYRPYKVEPMPQPTSRIRLAVVSDRGLRRGHPEFRVSAHQQSSRWTQIAPAECMISSGADDQPFQPAIPTFELRHTNAVVGGWVVHRHVDGRVDKL
jgi:hypothetical protein